MKPSDKLRAKMQAAIDRQKALVKAAEDASREMTAEETTEFDNETKAFDTAKAELARVEGMETRDAESKAAEKRAKSDVTGNIKSVTERDGNGASAGDLDAPVMTPAHGMFGQRKMTALERVGVVAWATAKNKHYPGRTPEEHLDDAGLQQIGDQCRALKHFARTEKTFLTTGANAGANTIMTPLSSEFIEFLRNESLFMRAGPVPIDLSYGKLDIAAGNGKTTAGYVAEGVASNATEATTRKVSLSAKHLTAITAIGNYNIEVSPLAVASILGDELAVTLMLAMDSAGLRGDGTGDNPAGLFTLTNAAHKFAAANSVAPTLAQVDADAKKALTFIAAANIPVRRRVWLMANRTFYYLAFMRDGNGNLVFPGLSLASPKWFGDVPVLVSEQIPTNLGAGTNESEIYLADFGHVLMGTARALTLKTSTEASYKNAGGTLVSAFAQDETVIRGIASHDFDMRHDKAASIMTAVKWGA